MKTARQWKDFYQHEREALGESGLARLLDDAPAVALPLGGALVFPHTRLTQSGRLIAAVANAVMASEADTVLAIGVLHGRDRNDGSIRRVHGTGVEADEFSLDNISVLIKLAARRAGKSPPQFVKRYPFQTGEAPAKLPGFEELVALRNSGAAIIATTDPIHHGAGYGTPAREQRPRDTDMTREWARRTIEEAFALLARRDYRAFLAQAQQVKSDFRDVGPVLGELVCITSFRAIALELVDYADVLDALEPTWAAGALVSLAQ